MKILCVHNSYQQSGGEDAVFASEVELLRNAGHIVETLEVSNDEIAGFAAMAEAALSAIYNTKSRERVAERLNKKNFDILHVHNFFPRLSPSIFDAAREAGVASVLTLHNFRLTCAAGTLFRDGFICQQCVDRVALPAVVHRCYRGSLAGSMSVATMIQTHKTAGTWRRKVDRFIALSSFAIDIFDRAGLPRDRIRIKPNYVSDVASSELALDRADESLRLRDSFLFVGRLSPEKGCATLLEAWRGIDAPLTVIGHGPELDRLRASAPQNVTFAGHQDSTIVRQAMADARAVIMPSQWFEAFGLVAIEAMMVGTPVIASRVGALPDIIKHGVTGLLVEPTDIAGLRQAVSKLARDDATVSAMGLAGRERYEANYTSSHNISILESIYAEAIASRLTDAG